MNQAAIDAVPEDVRDAIDDVAGSYCGYLNNPDQTGEHFKDFKKCSLALLTRIGQIVLEREAYKRASEAKTVTGHPYCSRSCEANAFQIEIRRLKAKLAEAAARYEYVRKLNVPAFQALYVANARGEGQFDDLVDAARQSEVKK